MVLPAPQGNWNDRATSGVEQLRTEPRAHRGKNAERARSRSAARVKILQYKKHGSRGKIAHFAQALPRASRSFAVRPSAIGRGFEHFGAARVHDPALDVLARQSSCSAKKRVHVLAEMLRHRLGHFRRQVRCGNPFRRCPNPSRARCSDRTRTSWRGFQDRLFRVRNRRRSSRPRRRRRAALKSDAPSKDRRAAE